MAGLIAGAAMSIFLAIITSTRGGDLWMAMKGAAVPLFHARAQQPGFDAPVVLLGVACHLAISIAWGVVFALLCFGLPRSATVFAGAAWGIVVWLVMYYVVLPIVGMGAVARSQPIANAVLTHVGFGLVIGLAFLPFQRTRTRTHAPPSLRAPVMP